MDAALNTMLHESVESMYIFALRNVFTGYMRSLTKGIMKHLMTSYEQITTADI